MLLHTGSCLLHTNPDLLHAEKSIYCTPIQFTAHQLHENCTRKFCNYLYNK